MQPSWRKPVGALAIVMLIIAWLVIVTTFSRQISALPWPLQTLVYLVAGIIWIAPLRPLLLWMETGRWRVRR